MDENLSHLIPAVQEQLESPATPYVREAFDRILGEPDIEEEEALNMIAFCLADELETLDREQRDFSEERYQLLLTLLPAMPEGK
ncbi:MAG: hypothetical protein ACON5H_00790 [Akkermansiaceae bacterium]